MDVRVWWALTTRHQLDSRDCSRQRISHQTRPWVPDPVTREPRRPCTSAYWCQTLTVTALPHQHREPYDKRLRPGTQNSIVFTVSFVILSPSHWRSTIDTNQATKFAFHFLDAYRQLIPLTEHRALGHGIWHSHQSPYLLCSPCSKTSCSSSMRSDASPIVVGMFAS